MTPTAPSPQVVEALEGFRGLLSAAEYTGPGVQSLLGTDRDVLTRAVDFPVHLRRLEGDDSARAALVRLFVLIAHMDADAADRALAPVGVDGLRRLGLVERTDSLVRASVRLVPHDDLVLASDLPGDAGAEHVAGVHRPSATLGYLTVRTPVEQALDVGTGSGIQALLLARHAGHVVATDVNQRALQFAAFNAALNGVENVEFVHGSFLDPVRDRRFGLVVCNPPYVISPESELLFRDSGLGSDRVSAQLLGDIPSVLDEGGFGSIMISWVQTGADPADRPRGWVKDSGCDAWIFHSSTDDPLTTAAGWLRDAPTLDEYGERIDRWLEYYHREGIDAVSYGAVVLRRRTTGRNWVRATAIPRRGLQPASDHVQRLFAAQDALAALGDDELLDRTVALVDGLTFEQQLGRADGHWTTREIALALEEGLPFRAGLDATTADIVRRLDPPRSLRTVLAETASQLELPAADLERAGVQLVRQMLELGFVTLTRDD